MPQKRITFLPCSERDVRAAALKATHERLKDMDEKRIPTVGKFGEILREEMNKIRSYAEAKAKLGICTPMSWEDMKIEINEFASKRKAEQEG